MAAPFDPRAGRALALGVFAMAAVAWIVSAPAVLVALIGGAPVALLIPRVTWVRRAMGLLVLASVAGALAGSLAFGRGGVASRLMAALVAGCAVAPWLVVVGWVRLQKTPARRPP